MFHTTIVTSGIIWVLNSKTFQFNSLFLFHIITMFALRDMCMALAMVHRLHLKTVAQFMQIKINYCKIKRSAPFQILCLCSSPLPRSLFAIT
ncbi:hypothetical protein GDO78_014615 [Eleutherodactylus coqui]|uniref:Uncharacterized protein n=1 Tax=Eleutherodactylus coqui TaxID=57060 RepID=A0A8J6E482_ELECQ|nr:hypothetical protein GDO78_014615 [Eleutherodactylus coqui]